MTELDVQILRNAYSTFKHKLRRSPENKKFLKAFRVRYNRMVKYSKKWKIV